MSAKSSDFRGMCIDPETARNLYGEGLDVITFLEDGIKHLEVEGIPQPDLTVRVTKMKKRLIAIKRKWEF